MAQLDLETIRHALQVARANGVARVELELGETSFHATLQPVPAVVRSPSLEPERAEEPDDVRTIVSPLVGYVQPGAGALEVGRHVARGEVLAVVSALGLANDVECPYDGELVEVLLEADAPVEYGQPLARVRVKA